MHGKFVRPDGNLWKQKHGWDLSVTAHGSSITWIRVSRNSEGS